MAYKLLCTDIDGTLANSRKEVSPRTRAAIRAAFDRGLYVTLATGRPPAGLASFEEVLPRPVPLICCNGAMLADSETREILQETTLSPDAVREITERSLPSGAAVIVWRGNELWSAGPPDIRAAYERDTRHSSLPLADFWDRTDGRANKVLLRGDEELIDACLQDLRVRTVKGTSFFTSSPSTLEIVARGTDKGLGLIYCASMLGIDPSEVIAVGDGMNDLPMFAVAGLSAAVENADEAVRARAGITVPSHDEDGVAWLIENYMLR